MKTIKLKYAPIAHARDAVFDIVEDMIGRSGMDAMWDEIDEETQHDIASTWADLIEAHFLGEEHQPNKGS